MVQVIVLSKVYRIFVVCINVLSMLLLDLIWSKLTVEARVVIEIISLIPSLLHRRDVVSIEVSRVSISSFRETKCIVYREWGQRSASAI